jgi:hypothetical protein
MYATVADMRAEGVTHEASSDERLEEALRDASALIDKATGQYFAPKRARYFLDGDGTPILETPVPPIKVEALAVWGRPQATDDLMLVGAPVQPGFLVPKLVAGSGVFPRGRGNVCVEGVWGYTEPADDPEVLPFGITPRDIRRATKLCAMRLLPQLGAAVDAADVRNAWRILEERTRDQSYRLAPAGDPGPFTGDPEIDRILVRYRRPAGLGAV